MTYRLEIKQLNSDTFIIYLLQASQISLF